VSKLEIIADKSKSFKHHDLDATLLLQTTEAKHENSHRLYWYITIPVIALVLMTIVICNTYPYSLRYLLGKFRVTTQPAQPAENPNQENKSRNTAEVSSTQQSSTSQFPPKDSEGTTEFVAYSVHPEA
jgi:cytochrome c-type biogenesis protein CcmH/NrfG